METITTLNNTNTLINGLFNGTIKISIDTQTTVPQGTTFYPFKITYTNGQEYITENPYCPTCGRCGRCKSCGVKKCEMLPTNFGPFWDVTPYLYPYIPYNNPNPIY